MLAIPFFDLIDLLIVWCMGLLLGTAIGANRVRLAHYILITLLVLIFLFRAITGHRS